MTRLKNRLLPALLLLLVFTCGVFAGNVLADGTLTNYTLTLNGSYVAGRINAKKDVDRYMISVPTSGTLSVSYQGLGIGDGYYQLMDEALAKSFFKHEIYTSSETSPKTHTHNIILEKGIYYLNVWGYGDHTGTYRVMGTFSAAGNNEQEPNDTFETAMSLPANTKVIGLISEIDTIDFFKINVPSHQKIKITYQGMISDSNFTLYNGNLEEKHKRNVYTGSEASPKTYVYEPELDAGIYYIKVTPYNTQRGRFTLSWTGTDTPAPPQNGNNQNQGQVGSTVTYSQQQYTVSGNSTVSYSKPSAVSTTVVIPDTITVGGVVYKVTAVSKEAFKGNKQIRKVVLGKNVKTIYGKAFADCTSLKTVRFANVIVIGKNAFSGCTSLKKIDLPATLKKINAGAFSGCRNLKKIIVRSSHLTKAKVGSGAFKGTSARPTVSVPAKKLKKYRKIFKGISKSARFVSIG